MWICLLIVVMLGALRRRRLRSSSCELFTCSAGSHLSSLALEASNSLLSPLSSHLGDCNGIEVSIVWRFLLGDMGGYDVNKARGGVMPVFGMTGARAVRASPKSGTQGIGDRETVAKVR
ncbi:hypothetical protein F5Y09DRAFT_5231 [Xylaria sp. FL1042]|nr:hypothetical protein F5Y09DRAFT_5231 [Xylaria sp. FL1042]